MNDASARISALKSRLGDDLCIMGHHYQSDAVAAHCDIMGDSLELSRRVADVTAKHIVFCGVFFMGESAALLARPGQQVHLPEPDADCMMSLMAAGCLARLVLEELRAAGRRVIPLAYVNTSLGLKAVVGAYGGAVCTSANARDMLAWALERADTVLFLPDRHLGRNTARAVGLCEEDWHVLRLSGDGIMEPSSQPLDRRILLWPGCCPIHGQMTPEMAHAAHAAHPGCRVLLHPECSPDAMAASDGAGSTSFLIREAARTAETSPGATLVIGTEVNLVNRLARRYAGKCTILPLMQQAFCPDMNMITAAKLLASLESIASGSPRPLALEEGLREPARLALTRMLDVCGK